MHLNLLLLKSRKILLIGVTIKRSVTNAGLSQPALVTDRFCDKDRLHLRNEIEIKKKLFVNFVSVSRTCEMKLKLKTPKQVAEMFLFHCSLISN